MMEQDKESKSKLQKALDELRDGFVAGFEISSEDRRDGLMDIREQRGKAEPTRASMMFNQHPVVDYLRQFKTIHGRNPQNNPHHTGVAGVIADAIPFAPFDDAAFAFRHNAGLNMGNRGHMATLPKNEGLLTEGQELAGKSADEVYKERKARAEREIAEQMPKYKAYLANLPATTKFGQFLGALGQDLVQNSTRGAWWLINAPQAVVDVVSEGVVGSVNPDLYGYEPIMDLPKAEKEGLIEFTAKREDLLKAGREFDLQEELNRRVSDYKSFLKPALDSGEITSKEYDSYIEEKKIIEEQRLRDDVSEVYKQYQDEFGGYGLSDDQIREEQMMKGKIALENDARYYKRHKPGVKKIGNRFKKRTYSPNAVNLVSMLPAAVGINAGLGLLNRPEGYEMVMPDEDDPRKNPDPVTAAVEQVGARYLLGRTGNLMDMSDFLNERPDVTAKEYRDYKTYLRDREIDLNPFDDGKINLGGVLKNNPDGIHGAEVSFLGKSIPFNEAFIPTAAAIGGTALGALLPNVRRLRMKRGNKQLPTVATGVKDGKSVNYNRYTDPKATKINKIMGYMPEIIERRTTDGGRQNNDVWQKSDNRFIKAVNPALEAVENFFEDPTKQGAEAVRKTRVATAPLALGAAGLAGGLALGGSIEEERRRRNFEERNPSGLDFDKYKENSQKLLDQKIQMAKENPNRDAERAESTVGFNKRAYQQALLTEAGKQQTLIDQMLDDEKKRRAQQADADRMEALNKFSAIESTIE